MTTRLSWSVTMRKCSTVVVIVTMKLGFYKQVKDVYKGLVLIPLIRFRARNVMVQVVVQFRLYTGGSAVLQIWSCENTNLRHNKWEVLICEVCRVPRRISYSRAKENCRGYHVWLIGSWSEAILLSSHWSWSCCDIAMPYEAIIVQNLEGPRGPKCCEKWILNQAIIQT